MADRTGPTVRESDAWRARLRDALERSLAEAVEHPIPQRPARPIAFNTEMVDALLAGRKTQTRRPESNWLPAVGDELWVRERWAPRNEADESAGYLYAADSAVGARWRPGRFMPRRASRLTLLVTSVRREPVAAISPTDAAAEGCPGNVSDAAPAWFKGVWQSIYAGGESDWDRNPAVLVVGFQLLRSPPSPL